MNQHSIIVAIRDGVAEVDHDPDNAVLVIDWDEIGNTFDYADETFSRVKDSNLPDDTKRDITDLIIEVWPDMEAARAGM
jgi:hypothetical protein